MRPNENSKQEESQELSESERMIDEAMAKLPRLPVQQNPNRDDGLWGEELGKEMLQNLNRNALKNG